MKKLFPIEAINQDLDDSIRQFIVDNLNWGSEPDNQERWRNTRRLLVRTVADQVNDMTGNQIPTSLIRTVLEDNTSINLLDQDDSEEGERRGSTDSQV